MAVQAPLSVDKLSRRRTKRRAGFPVGRHSLVTPTLCLWQNCESDSSAGEVPMCVMIPAAPAFRGVPVQYMMWDRTGPRNRA
ncbi:hypothetical protein Pcinc_005965 [Petrolisthes cinctipes]|uniref:Uncharacterized protein n=1 Tax=Petrolisthes cinctipes TaxID=88211 RepID=A0AAE1L211_PETCI|nr:hypothetical protein Pcinc_005965 [Petrolisthes cinctipes]